MKNQKKVIKEFVKYWQDKGYEKGESQSFWLSLLRDVLGVERPEQYITFEDQVKLDHTSFIDGYINNTHVMIEQKGRNKDLNKAIKQSDGSYLTPFQQAKRYSAELPYSERPRWIVTSNFKEFHVYDMEKPQGEPEIIELKNLEKEYYRLEFLVKEGNEHLKKEMEISLAAGEIVGEIYDAFSKQYKDISNEKSSKSLNMLCVRLVFCLYAEDAEIFGKKGMFHDYLKDFSAKHMRKALIDLFKVLDTPVEERDPYLDDELLAFPYVNGGLFEDEEIEIPNVTDEIRELLLAKASDDFDWSEISPTIFGAVFESTLNPETRRSGGMHYTSLENIHKVIDPLFLDDLKAELDEIKQLKQMATIKKRVEAFQNKLSSLNFLDPAAGSGNFLTETYISLRKLENEAIFLQQNYTDRKMVFDEDENPIKVSIQQFYGIEINDFAVSVAKTALWIAESQMMKETEDIVHINLDFLPLKTNAYIHEGNALRIDWNEFLPYTECSYILGNPPFIGFTFMSENQKKDMEKIFPNVKNLDYVCGWYKKANDYIKGTNIECCFVSTNSITQGETVARLWEFLDFKINYAYQSFVWNSETSLKAHVHCVIIGFADFNRQTKFLFKEQIRTKVSNINPYLIDTSNIIVSSRSKPLCNVSKMVYGNKPADGGFLIIEDKDYENFIKKEPHSKKFIRPLLGAVEFLNNKKRWCLWLKGISPVELRNCPLIMERISKCKAQRESSKAAGIRKFAQTPSLFAQITQPDNKNYVLIPRVSSERRKYIPMDFLTFETIVTDAVQIVPDASMYEFGILTSNVHMAWMRVVAGRLESRYRYSKDVVYNNFPWCQPTPKQKAKIEQTAQAILDARSLYPDSSLADLYDELTMPVELRKAHQENDKAVMAAYGFTKKAEDGRNVWLSESETVAELFKMYEKLVKEK